MIQYRYLVHDDEGRIRDREFIEFADAFDYAQDGLYTYISEVKYVGGREDEDAEEIIWSWDDPYDRSEAIARNDTRIAHRLQEDQCKIYKAITHPKDDMKVLDEKLNQEEQARFMELAKELNFSMIDIVNFAKDHGNATDKDLLNALEQELKNRGVDNLKEEIDIQYDYDYDDHDLSGDDLSLDFYIYPKDPDVDYRDGGYIVVKYKDVIDNTEIEWEANDGPAGNYWSIGSLDAGLEWADPTYEYQLADRSVVSEEELRNHLGYSPEEFAEYKKVVTAAAAEKGEEEVRQHVEEYQDRYQPEGRPTRSDFYEAVNSKKNRKLCESNEIEKDEFGEIVTGKTFEVYRQVDKNDAPWAFEFRFEPIAEDELDAAREDVAKVERGWRLDQEEPDDAANYVKVFIDDEFFGYAFNDEPEIDYFIDLCVKKYPNGEMSDEEFLEEFGKAMIERKNK